MQHLLCHAPTVFRSVTTGVGGVSLQPPSSLSNTTTNFVCTGLCRVVPGGAGRRRDIPAAEVKQHNTADDAWIVLHGKVSRDKCFPGSRSGSTHA